MKKIVFFSTLILLLTACGARQALDLNKLTIGMTVDQVVATVGPPDRILAANNKKEGYQEVLEYRTSRDEVYALEFWDNYLTGYEFLYDDVSYTPSLMPPVVWPIYGRPIYIYPGHHHHHPNYPNRPNRPSTPNRPSQPDRPGQSNRPSQPNRPGQSDRPGQSSRPSQPSRPETVRPSRPETTRPSTVRPAESNRRPSRTSAAESGGRTSDDKTKKD